MNQNMSSVQYKARNSKKAKTSILFDLKTNTEKNIEFAQSLNIISLKQASKIHGQDGSHNVQVKSTEHGKYLRKSQNPKLSLKINCGGLFCFEEDTKKTMPSLHTNGSSRQNEVGDVIDRLHRAHLIVVDKDTIRADISSFSIFCSQFLQKIKELENENLSLSGNLKKYESYLRFLKTKDLNDCEDIICENMGIKNEKNLHLKVLNLQRKIQTMNYVIKNYRSNNKEEIKNFEKKLNQFRPSIEVELTAMLAEANKKNEELEELSEYFQKQCEKYYKNGNWVEIARELKEKDQEIGRLNSKIVKMQAQIEEEIKSNRENQECKIKLSSLEEEMRVMRVDLSSFKMKKEQFQEELVEKTKQFQEIERAYEELTYKVKALQGLQPKIKEKQEQLRKNSSVIARLQDENLCLKAKISTLISNVHSELLLDPSKSLQTCNSTIQDLSSRFCQQIDNMFDNKQESLFMIHLYQKTKQSFEKIIDEYRQQLQNRSFEIKELKSRLNFMLAASRKKFEQSQEIVEEVKAINSKRKRCLNSQKKIEESVKCTSCMDWVLHWGQLNNLYDQLENLVQKLKHIN